MQRKSSSSVKIFYPKYSREYLIEELKRRFKDISGKYSIKLAILFGSYAKNRYTASSDIDILIVHNSRKRNLYSRLRMELSLKGVELHIYRLKEYRRIKDKISKMIEDGVILYSSNKL